jgi:hypothetical protein
MKIVAVNATARNGKIVIAPDSTSSWPLIRHGLLFDRVCVINVTL